MAVLDPQSKAYYLALGAFHHAYTDLEHELTCIIRNVVSEGRKTPQEYQIAVSLLSGGRMASLKDTIKRLLRILAVDRPTMDAVDKTFAHLGDIQFFRDRLAHHYTRPLTTKEPAIWVNDDYAASRELGKGRPLEFRLSTVRHAVWDLNAIKNYLDPIFSDYVTPSPGEPRLKFDPGKMPTWRYKPGELAPHRPKSGGSQK